MRPRVIYDAKPGSPLEVDRELYGRLARETGRRTLVDRFVVPRRTGRAWPVRAGQIFRIVAVEGPQVADLNVWSLSNPRERFWASRTRQLHQAHPTTFDRLWSNVVRWAWWSCRVRDAQKRSRGFDRLHTLRSATC